MAKKIQREVFSIDAGELIRIFGDALYQDFGALLRELVQNSHDAIVEAGKNRGHLIWISFNEATNKLRIIDNGIGMSSTNITDCLNRFAYSDKTDKYMENTDLIGEFGIGFFAAVAFSKSVTVLTKRSDSQPIRWTYSHTNKQPVAYLESLDKQDYISNINHFKSDIDIATEGTFIECEIRKDIEHTTNVDASFVETQLRKYCAMLPIQIFLSGAKVNAKIDFENKSAISLSERKEFWRDWVYKIKKIEPGHMVLLNDDQIGLEGVLWVLKDRAYLKPRADIYLRNMLISEQSDILMPDWASCVNGVINSRNLKRTVSGDTLKKNDTLKSTKAAISKSILDLIDILYNSGKYQEILGIHDRDLKYAATYDDELFKIAKKWFTFPLAPAFNGDLYQERRLHDLEIWVKASKVADHLESEKVIITINNANQTHEARIVQGLFDCVVVDLSKEEDNLIANKICERDNLVLLSIGELVQRELSFDEEIKQLEHVKRHLKNIPNVELVISSFNSDEHPTMLLSLKNFKGTKSEGSQAVLFLNKDNSLIRKVLHSTDKSAQLKVIKCLYEITRISTQPHSGPLEKELVIEYLAEAFEYFIE